MRRRRDFRAGPVLRHQGVGEDALVALELHVGAHFGEQLDIAVLPLHELAESIAALNVEVPVLIRMGACRAAFSWLRHDPAHDRQVVHLLAFCGGGSAVKGISATCLSEIRAS